MSGETTKTSGTPGRAALRRIVALVPTYNERENLASLVQRVRRVAPEVDVCVLDDASPDGTGRIADELAAADPQVHVLHRPGKAGLGAAYLQGFVWALGAGYDAVIEIDADGSHRPQDLPRLIEAAADADVVIGSRWVPGGQVVNWPGRRKALSLGANAYTRLWLGMPVRDATAGFRLYRASALRDLDLQAVASQGYCFQVDLTWRAVKAGLVVVEVPIVFVERENGASKMSGDIVRESMRRIAWWGAVYRGEQVLHAARRLAGRDRPTASPEQSHPVGSGAVSAPDPSRSPWGAS
ncbi:glycosyltransferase involved in cell wall biosynthesis [Kineosphaera limosa]|uniref:Polyprenol-phosphate mannosyltransferase n=1 Tax=Kineosphaera limosa NBRC 100340 TaxID=1184609 RepID=K6VJ39_9MICO|nr:polyprenol monophosphomannose synthase [Kineosphaera limosa]NYE03233.1 glycosyltransferase involved in cell wall biosynthesis [Kineosphaera limosa]GAB96243.1 polyprenol-phosphate mannosyltransferase [Kineosphaera limosa NBRC 100340]